MKKWLLWLGGALAVLGFAILGRDERRAKKAEAQRDELILDGSDRARAKAVAADEKAARHQQAAVEAAEVGQKALDKVGAQGETVADLLDRWHKPDSGV